MKKLLTKHQRINEFMKIFICSLALQIKNDRIDEMIDAGA